MDAFATRCQTIGLSIFSAALLAVSPLASASNDEDVDLTLTQSGPSGNTVQAGSVVTYQFTATNKGPDTARDVTVTTYIPSALSFHSNQSDSRCVLNGSQVHCHALSMAPNETRTYQVAFTVSNDQQFCDSTVRSDASVSTSSTETNPADNQSNTVTHTVECQSATADVQITKSGPSSAQLGGTVQYTLTVHNNGPGTATSLTADDFVPNGLSYNSAQSSAECVELSSKIYCGQLPTLAPNASKTYTLSFTVRNNDNLCGTTLTNKASVSVESTDPNPSNNQSNIVNTTVQCPEPDRSDVSVTKTGPSSVQFGDTVTYTVTAHNNGPDAAQSVTVSDVIPNHLNFNAGQSSNECVQNGNNIHCAQLPTLAAGSSKTYTLVFDVESQNACGKTISNTATVSVESTDPNPSNNQSNAVSTTVECEEPDESDVSITKSGPSSVQFGNTVTYTVTAHNNGPDAAQSVTVSDVIPDRLTYKASQSSSDCVQNGNNIHCAQLPTLAAGSSKTYTLVFDVESQNACGKTLSNTATISVESTDPNPSNNTSNTVNTTVQCPNPTFSLSKTDGRSTAERGDTLTYTISITNTSGVNAKNVTLRDVLPNDVTFVSASSGGTASGHVVQWTNLSINAGQSVTHTVSATVNSAVSSGTVLTNTANIVGGPGATDTTTVTVAEPTLNISKTDNRSTVQPNETLTYTVTVKNTSDVNATNVDIVDTLPSQLQFLGASTPHTRNGQKIRWEDRTIAANSQQTFTVTARVPSNTAHNTSLLNTAQIVSGNSATDTTQVKAEGDLTNVTIDLTDLRDPVRPDETFCYQITVSNLNNVALNNVDVTQSLDSQTDFSSASNNGSHSSGVISWNIDMSANGTRTLGSCVRVDDDAEDDEILQSSAFVDNKSDDETTRVREDEDEEDECTVESIHDTPDPVEPDETLEYDIRIRNNGNDDRDFDIRAFLDNDVRFRSASDGGFDIDDREVEWNNIAVDEDETETLRLTVRVDDNVRDGDHLRLEVRCEDDTEQETTQVESDVGSGDARLSINKSANRREAKPGDTVFYTITVRNNSNRSADDVRINDRFTAGSISIEDAGGGNVTGNGIRWTVSRLQANGSRTFTYRVRISQSMRHGQIISNTVRATSPDVGRDATDVEEVRIITDLPQTGLGSFFASAQEANRHLSSSDNSSGEAAGNTATVAWITIVSLGLMGGGALGRRFWL